MSKPLQEIIELFGKDETFRSAVRKNTREAFKEHGYVLPEGVELVVHENGPRTIHAALPVKNENVLDIMKRINPPMAKVFERCWADTDFKERFRKDPRAGYKELIGVEVPSGVELHAHEDTDKKLNIILPFVPEEKGELSDADLEMVAGGKSDDAVDEACYTAGAIGAEVAIEGAIIGASSGGPLGAAIGVAPGGIVAGVSFLTSALK